MVVSWSTPASVARPRLLLGDASGQLSQVIPAQSRPSPGLEAVQHQVRLSGLDPNTRYFYQATHEGARSSQFDFRTAARLDARTSSTVRFTAFGDQGTAGGKVGPVLSTIEKFGPDLHLHVGDLSYASNTGGALVYEQVETLYQPAVRDTWLAAIEPLSARIPWMPVLGNHEMEPDGTELGYSSYFARFAPPANGVQSGPDGATWSLRIGNVGFVALDGNDASAEIPRNHGYLGGDQEEWLDDRLAALRADDTIDWIVVGFHHCAYCSSVRHGSDAGVREAWTCLFDKYEVDVVINGHNRMYERTHPIRGGEATVEAPKGATIRPALGRTTYLVSGLAGEGETLPDRSTRPVAGLTHYTGADFGLRVPETTPWSAVVDENASVVICAEATPAERAGATTLVIRSVDAATGDVVDDLTLERRR